MKQQDLAIIILAGFISAGLAFGVTSMLFKPSAQKITVEKVEQIQSQFNEPDKKVFNEQAVNPTQLIQIGDGSSANPF